MQNMGRSISRRHFIRNNTVLATGLAFSPFFINGRYGRMASNPIRLGGPVPGRFSDPAEWVKAVKSLGYSAAYCPVQPDASEDLIRSFRTEAKRSNIIIAEVGAWSNTLDPDEKARQAALKMNIDALRLAEEIGASCCVNISGARGEIWDGPYPGNYSRQTFELIVETVRYIIDQVKPVNSFYSLEPMPYMLPDSPDSYLELITAVGRKQFGVHLDPVNMISSPQKYFNNALFLKECFSKLGPYIKSIHAKDITILPELTVHLQECRPGTGLLDYTVFLQEASRLSDVPFMLEHLETQMEYKLAADYVREVGKEAGIPFV
jgi:sugar phosphate isomerase/epimerase